MLSSFSYWQRIGFQEGKVAASIFQDAQGEKAMATQKLDLNSLKVSSFVTEPKAAKVKGGFAETYGTCGCMDNLQNGW